MKQLRAIEGYLASLPLMAYCVVAGIVALAGSTGLCSVALLVAHALGFDTGLGDLPESPGLIDGFGTIIFAPLAETFLLVGGLSVVSRLGRAVSCVASAIAWGALHGLLAPIQFFGTVWSFFVFGFGYLLWRRRSVKHAFAAAAVPHFLVNGVLLLVWAIVA